MSDRMGEGSKLASKHLGMKATHSHKCIGFHVPTAQKLATRTKSERTSDDFPPDSQVHIWVILSIPLWCPSLSIRL